MGDIVPAGYCPECGGLAYLLDEELIDADSLYKCRKATYAKGCQLRKTSLGGWVIPHPGVGVLSGALTGSF